MIQGPCENLDPRIRRSRQLLQKALETLLETNEFDNISVHDIAAAATVNRATFYAHYPDKFALLECLVDTRFHELLAQRGVQFDNCSSALKATVLAVCDYLTQTQGSDPRRRLEPHRESAIIAVVRRMLLEGLTRQPWENAAVAPEIIASTASWAIYGAAKEWVQTPDRCPSAEMANTVAMLVSPILHLAQEHPSQSVA